MNREKKPDNKKINNAVRYAALGTELGVLLGGAVWGGLALDKAIHTSPLFIILFPTLALIIVFIQLYKSVTKRK